MKPTNGSDTTSSHTGLAVGATTAAVLTADEGLRRTAYYVGNLIVPLMRYRFVEWQVSDLPPAEQEKHYQYLHDIYCNEPLRVILELKGFYIKMGQVMSSMNEELPKQYIDSLKVGVLSRRTLLLTMIIFHGTTAVIVTTCL